MRKFWQQRKGLVVLMAAAMAVAAVLQAQPPGGPGGPGGFGPGNFQNRMAMGTVESVNGNQIVVKTRDGQTRTVVVGDQGTIIRFSQGTKADLKEKQIVSVVGQYDQNRAWFIPRRVQVGQVEEGLGGLGPGGRGILMGVGQIYNVKDNQILLSLPLALSGETQIVRQDKIQPAQIQAGEEIFAFGEPGEDNTITAQRITVGDMQLAMPMGPGMMGGPGGFGGRRGGAGRGGRGGQ